VLLIPARRLDDFTPGSWRYLVAGGFAATAVVLTMGWVASRDSFQRGDSPLARTLRRLTDDDE
jgi:hypothetical protein